MYTQPTDTAPASPPDHVGMNAAAFLLMVAGWGGLYWLINNNEPRVGQRWLFFILLYIAVSSTLVPFVRLLHERLTPLSRHLPPGGVIVRECAFAGLWVVACAWLLMPRAFSWTIAFFLALALIVIEVFLRLREIPGEVASE